MNRRDELLARCARERIELAAAAAAVRMLVPRGRELIRWVRTVRRVLQVIARSHSRGAN